MIEVMLTLSASCLRNAVSMFHILERETEWRRQNGRPEGFGAMRARRPVIAVGAEDPLEDQKMLADYFRTCIASWFLYSLTFTPQMDPTASEASMQAYVNTCHFLPTTHENT
jgi:hypothetical protein